MRGIFDIVAREAGGQHARISWEQVLALGADRGHIERWLADGRLHQVHHGVYAIGHPGRSVEGDYMASVLACGDGAVLSCAAATYTLKLRPGAPPPAEVTVPTTAGRARPGIVIHRVKFLHPYDVSDLDGIPITTVPRTLLDMAPRLTTVKLARACHQAWVRHETRPEWIEACIERNPNKPGAKKLRAALGSDATLSLLEDGFLALLRKHGFRKPRTNIDVRGDKVDTGFAGAGCHWPDRGLTVELLSYRFHASRQAFEADVARRRRSNHLAFTWGDVFEREAQTIAELRAVYASS
jgi:hypothetical protein